MHGAPAGCWRAAGCPCRPREHCHACLRLHLPPRNQALAPAFSPTYPHSQTSTHLTPANPVHPSNTRAILHPAAQAAGFGPLKGGTLCRVSTQFARQLAARPAFLAALGAALKFELAVGANGRVWVNAATPATAAAVCRVLGRAQGLEEREALELVQDALRDLRL